MLGKSLIKHRKISVTLVNEPTPEMFKEVIRRLKAHELACEEMKLSPKQSLLKTSDVIGMMYLVVSEG